MERGDENELCQFQTCRENSLWLVGYGRRMWCLISGQGEQKFSFGIKTEFVDVDEVGQRILTDVVPIGDILDVKEASHVLDISTFAWIASLPLNSDFALSMFWRIA